MRKPVAEGIVQTLESYATGAERMKVVRGDLWIHFAGKPSESKLLAALTPKRLGGVGTLRYWNTVRRPGEMVGG